MVQKVSEVEIHPDDIHIDLNEVLSLLKYEAANADQIILDNIKYLIEKARELIFPKGGYIILQKNDDVRKGEVKLNEVSFKTDKIISSQLKHAEYIALFMCTIGKKPEYLSSLWMSQNEMLNGYIMSIIGSVCAEETAEYIHTHIENEAKANGFNVTNRFSPGYCNWKVDDQFKLFSFFPDNFSNIRLTESALMDPVKSVSGMIGIGRNVKRAEYKCKTCSNSECLYRKI